MRPNTVQVINGLASSTINGVSIPADQVWQVSGQIVASGTPTGTFKLQACNDLGPTPTNWTDIANATVNVTSNASYLIPKTDIAYAWVRGVYTATGAGAQTVAPIADTGVKQAQTVTTAADVAGSLNSTYFTLSSVNTTSKAQKNFYVWFNINSAGVDPALAGKTGIPITGATGVSANTLATSIRSALNALTGDFTATGSNAAVIITNVAFGPVTAVIDGAGGAATHFTIGSVTTGVASNLNNKYFFLNSEADARQYYVWMNVDGIGTSPAPAGLTAIEVDFTSGASASTIGTAMATAIGSAHSSGDFTTSGTTTVTVTNQAAGPFTRASDFNSGFTIAVTAGGGTVIANMKTSGS